MKAKTCTWKYDGDDEDDVYWTECGEGFVTTAGTPEDNKIKYCPFCGKKIKEHKE